MHFVIAAYVFLTLCCFCDFSPVLAAEKPASSSLQADRLPKRWLFEWRNLSDPKEVDRMIARFPRAKAAGYNGVVFSHNVAASKAGELKEAARQYELDLIVTVMANSKDRNYTEGVLVTNALFQVRERHASVQQDKPTRVLNGDFEDVKGNHFKSWGFQDDEGVTTFADNQVVHGGKVSLRMENISQNPNHVCRLSQVIKLQPHRQYAISFWIKTEALSPADPEVK